MDKVEKNLDDNKKIGIAILIFGIIITSAAIIFIKAESKWSGILAIIGGIIATIGVTRLTLDYEKTKRFLYSFGFLAAIVTLIFVIDFIDTSKGNNPPRFVTHIETIKDMIIYKTPFYEVYRINPNTQSEYYIVDQIGKYTKDTVPTSEFNRLKSGIDKIINYKHKYVGNSTNDGNLISHLPLSEYGYTFEIDSENLGLKINYKTNTSSIDQMYFKKSLLYNSVSIFTLIENVEFVKICFSDKTYDITREEIQNLYPNYIQVEKDKILNKDSFNIYVENMMKDNEFVLKTFSDIFE